MTEYLQTPQGRRIAYERRAGQGGPGVVFLGGFKSDMRGSKAEHLAEWAARTGRAFLRFDYSGHGESDGAFEDGSIGDWFADALAAIDALTEGPQVLIGSSMGGWISLLVARTVPDRVAGLIGIAAAPDFTKNGFWAAFDDATRREVMEVGQITISTEYDDEPYIITRRLIEDGLNQLVLESPLPLPFPVRLFHGTADVDVPEAWALRLLHHAESPDMQLMLVKGADHRFSTPECLSLIEAAAEELVRG